MSLGIDAQNVIDKSQLFPLLVFGYLGWYKDNYISYILFALYIVYLGVDMAYRKSASFEARRQKANDIESVSEIVWNQKAIRIQAGFSSFFMIASLVLLLYNFGDKIAQLLFILVLSNIAYQITMIGLNPVIVKKGLKKVVKKRTPAKR